VPHYYVEDRDNGWQSRPVPFDTDDDALAGMAELGWLDLEIDHQYLPVDNGFGGCVAAKKITATAPERKA